MAVLAAGQEIALKRKVGQGVTDHEKKEKLERRLEIEVGSGGDGNTEIHSKVSKGPGSIPFERLRADSEYRPDP